MALNGRSRTQRKAGTKSNACPACPVSKKNGKKVLRFKGRGRARLEQHLQEVHGR